jgi:TrmH family RNA methyltransferase
MCAVTGPSEPVAEVITSRRNPLVRRLRELHRGDGRRQQGLLLVEGTHLLEEVLRLALTPQLVLATPDWMAAHPVLTAALPKQVPLRQVSVEVLESASTTRHPDGVLLTLVPPLVPRPSSRPALVMVLDRLQDPGNLGTLLRTALAAGVDQVWLGEGADPFQPKALRASSGAALALPIERWSAQAGLQAALVEARAGGTQLVAAVVPEPDAPGSAAVPYWQLDWRVPTALLLGNEGAGLAPELMLLADRLVTIPHSPAVESLNVAAAAALLLLERWRQAQGGGAT